MHTSPSRELLEQNPILQALPPEKEVLRRNRYRVVAAPGLAGHPKSPILADGAVYIADGFEEKLEQVGVEREERLTLHRKSFADRALSLLTGFLPKRKDDGLIYKAAEFKEETRRDYDALVPLFAAGERVIHTAASHDAIGRALAFKKAYPAATILHWDKHSDWQDIESGDAPGTNPDQVRGHAYWKKAVAGEGSTAIQDTCPEGAPRYERGDLFEMGTMHPDKSEAYAVAGIDPKTGERVNESMPYATWEQIYGSADGPLKREKGETQFAYVTRRLRAWIDERKQRYGVDVIPMGIEDDPDSIRATDINGAVNMTSNFGTPAELKFYVFKWLSKQPDVDVRYYGSSEVRRDRDTGAKVRNAIVQWGSAAMGFGDVQYYHGGYNADRAESGRMLDLATATGKRIAGTMIQTAAAVAITLAAVSQVDDAQEMPIAGKAGNGALAKKDATPSSVPALPIMRGYSNQESQAASEYLALFHKSGFKEKAAQLRFAIGLHDEAEVRRLKGDLMKLYELGLDAAPDSARSHVGEVALSEFTRGFGQSTEWFNRVLGGERDS